MVIRGGIDGYSRFITFLKASTNNSAQTVLNHFTEAVEQYAVPSRVRTDHGEESVGIWHFMEDARGENHGSFIAGRSTHNQFVRTLSSLESDEHLDHLNDFFATAERCS